jgi:DNA-directed RNA polymerase specialized sigma24 family protein
VVQDLLVSDDRRMEGVYRAEAARLWRALVAFSGDPDLASDAVSEAFAQALAVGDQHLRSPAGWIRHVAFRVASGELKERPRVLDVQSHSTYEIPEPIDH